MKATAPCPLCSIETSTTLFELRHSPILLNRLFASRDEALAAKRVDSTFHYCGRCHFAFNPAFDRGAVDYEGYYNKQTESSHFRRSIEALVDRLAVDCELGRESGIVEVGCGNGYFLSRLKARTTAESVHGYDPAYRGEYGLEANVRRRLFDAADMPPRIDLVVIRHCLEGILDSEPFIRLLSNASERARLYVEITDLDHILTERNPSLLWHEYYRYFSARSLDIFLRKMGFRLHQVYALFGNSNLGVTAIRAPATSNLDDAYQPLEAIVRSHRKVVIWGVSGRAISLLCHMSWGPSVVAHGVDIDVARQGQYVPVTGQVILSPAEARAFDPDLVIVSNESYALEIREALGGRARFVTVAGRFI